MLPKIFTLFNLLCLVVLLNCILVIADEANQEAEFKDDWYRHKNRRSYVVTILTKEITVTETITETIQEGIRHKTTSIPGSLILYTTTPHTKETDVKTKTKTTYETISPATKTIDITETVTSIDTTTTVVDSTIPSTETVTVFSTSTTLVIIVPAADEKVLKHSSTTTKTPTTTHYKPHKQHDRRAPEQEDNYRKHRKCHTVTKTKTVTRQHHVTVPTRTVVKTVHGAATTETITHSTIVDIVSKTKTITTTSATTLTRPSRVDTVIYTKAVTDVVSETSTVFLATHTTTVIVNPEGCPYAEATGLAKRWYYTMV
ncbi:hypothetical protein BC937DRAFT_90567 [Endogone sp. FLAS-F59071]|nr:hypothetical protein BC937DRAFT_90567 [Endogone sp. FLAS-F59071]|eukprot:RUS22050.1 hypothetical protein BC937DRAFT_90567 [Endogone sp. FLAS-F59071]